MSALRKIDKLSFLRSTTRSQTVEFLVDNYVEHLIQVALQDKK